MVDSLGAGKELNQTDDWSRLLLGQILRYYPHDLEDGMWRNRFWLWWEEKSGFLLGPFLIAVSLVVNKYLRPYWATHFLDDLIVALLIAGILTLTVDPYVKRRARQEATRDIFHHMLGYSLPPEIRERLHTTVEQTRLYRRDLNEHIVISEVGDSLIFETEVEFEVFNPTPHNLDFQPHMEFEKSEDPELKSLICFGESDCGANAVIRPTKNGMGLECVGKTIAIPSGGSKRFKYEYSVKYPTSLGVYYPHFKYPTIGLSLTIKAPPSLTITATPAEYHADGEWRYPRQLFMPGEQFGIVWEKIAEHQA